MGADRITPMRFNLGAVGEECSSFEPGLQKIQNREEKCTMFREHKGQVSPRNIRRHQALGLEACETQAEMGKGNPQPRSIIRCEENIRNEKQDTDGKRHILFKGRRPSTGNR